MIIFILVEKYLKQLLWDGEGGGSGVQDGEHM